MKNLYKFKALAFCAVLFPLFTNAQNSYTFTSAGVSGPNGPSQTQINTAYASTNLSGSVNVSGGIQSFTVPVTGPYRITAIGAQGAYNGGSPASIAGDFTLTAGTVLKILVGQTGTQAGNSNSPVYTAGGGGGGSYVTNTANVPYIVAGGGGGNGDGYTGVPVTCCLNGMQAATVTAGNPFPSGSNGGTAGNGGTCGSPTAGGGAGITGNGNVCSSGTAPLAFVNGGTGGSGGGSPTSGDGGFGGGAGGYNSGVGQRGGGGGGYSGGGGGTANTGNDAAGGGGGSYNNGANQTNAVSTSTGNGKVIIDLLCFLNVTASTPNPTAPAICSGNSVTLTVNAISGYSWSTGNTTSSVIVVSPTSTQTYSVSGTSTANCSTSAVITVTVSSGSPSLSVLSSTNNVCAGKSVTLTASGALTYTWSNGVTNGVAFIPSSTNTYTVTGENGCGTSSAVTSITVAPIVVSASASPTLVCAGSPATISAVSPVSGYTWQPFGFIGNTVVITPTVNSSYTVTASDGTCIGTAVVSLSVKPSPTITAATSATMVCQGATATLTANGGLSYVWTPGTNLTGSTVTVSPTIPTLYQVVGTNSLGCTSYTDLIIITVQSPTVGIVSNKPTVCVGGLAVLNATGATVYSWTGGPSTSVYSVNPQVSTTYTVTGTDPNTTCSDTETITINVFNPVVNISSPSPSVCPGATATVVVNGATSYTLNGSQGSVPSIFIPTSTDVYTVSALTASNNLVCPASNTITITVLSNPTVTIVATKTVMCKKDAGPFLTAGGAATYQWSNNSSTSTTISVAPPSTTTYTVTGTDVNGCVNSSTIQIKVDACTGISEANPAQSQVIIYPNPNNGEFKISAEVDLDLKLFNELGQEIRTIKLSLNNNHMAVVNDLPVGIYFVSGQNGTLQVNQKVVITK